jgi:hypothetical protein
MFGDDLRGSAQLRRVADRLAGKGKVAREVAQHARCDGEIRSSEDEIDAERAPRLERRRDRSGGRTDDFQVRGPRRKRGSSCTSAFIVAVDAPMSLNPTCRIPSSSAASATGSASSIVRSARVSIRMKSIGAFQPPAALNGL